MAGAVLSLLLPVLGDKASALLLPLGVGSVLLLFCLWLSGQQETRSRGGDSLTSLMTVLVVALALRVALGLITPGQMYDVNCFVGWAQQLQNIGMSGFYRSDMFVDYPPGYFYPLTLMGALVNKLALDPYSPVGVLLVTLPAILADVLLVGLAWRVAERFGNVPAMLAAIWMTLCPLLIYNSAVWKQVDSLITLVLLLAFIRLEQRSYVWAAFWYGVAVIIKPQAFLFGPVFAFAFLLDWMGGREQLRRTLTRVIGCGMFCIGIIVLLATPFWGAQKSTWLPELYFGTMSYYNYGTVNAPNLFALLGQNYQPADTTKLLFLPLSTWGFLLLIPLLLGLAYCALRMAREGNRYLLLLGGLFTAGVYTFIHGMHERYIIPSLIFLLFAVFKEGHRRLLPPIVAMMLTALSGEALVLLYLSNIDLYSPLIFSTGFRVLGLAQILSFVWLLLCGLPILLGNSVGLLAKEGQGAIGTPSKPEPESQPQKQKRQRFSMLDTSSGALFDARLPLYSPRTHPARRLDVRDLLYMVIPTLICAGISFYALGSRDVPMNGMMFQQNHEPVTVELPTEAAEVWLYMGSGEGEITLRENTSGSEWMIMKQEYTDLYSWKVFAVSPSRSWTISMPGAHMLEVAFVGADGKSITPTSYSEFAYLVFDEQEKRPERPSYLTDMYFDEIYHARTAYEYQNGLPIYETTHPPLGKEMIMSGIMLFGMNPFGWRFFGTLAGVLLLPVVYLLARRLTGSASLGLFCEVLMLFDFMRFTQSRIATIDTFPVLFILLAYYYMLRFCLSSPYQKSLPVLLLFLFLSGACFGIASAMKWTGFYAGIGLCILFFTTLVGAFRGSQSTPGKTYNRRLVIYLFAGAAFFVVVPAVIYILSYVPIYYNARQPFSLTEVLQTQGFMFDYHDALVSDHPFASQWWSWPFVVKPIWYYAGTRLPAGTTETIALLGNPIIWVPAAVSVLVLLGFQFTKKRSFTGLFVVVAALSQYLPWVLISRQTFLYHYFPTLPFTILAMVVLSSMILRQRSHRMIVGTTLISLAAVGFILFYPIISGQGVESSYVQSLQLFPSWHFGG